MTNSVSGRTFRVLGAVLLPGALMLVADGALARTVNIQGTHSASEIKNACGASGGQYLSGGVNFAYGC
jgi:hypothetical protein